MAAKASRIAQPASRWFTAVKPAIVAAKRSSPRPSVLTQPKAVKTHYTGSLSAPSS